MARRRRSQTVDSLLTDIDAQLEHFAAERAGLSLREKVLLLVEVYRNVRDLGVNTVREHGITTRAARERIRLYFLEYVGVVIAGEELAVVSGILDYPRRIRELRVELGYQLASGASPDPAAGVNLKPDEYMLVVPEPDVDAARRWHVANRIRKSPEGSRSRVLQFLQENVGRVVTTEELSYVAKNAKEFARRVRELRTEEGFAISTRFTGRPDLAVGQYVLESIERIAQPHDRHIPQEVQREVYERDSNTCRLCGWNRERQRPDDPRILELHHIQQHAHGGQNEPGNLIVICSRCHDDVHAGRRTLPMTEG